LLAYTGLNLISAATFVVVLSQWHEKQVIQQIERRLHNAALLVRSDVENDLPRGRTAQLQSRVRALGKLIGMRITLVAIDGQVLADSEEASLAELARMDNHKGRPELQEAAKVGVGRSERTSPTLGEPMLYVAVRAEEAGQVLGFVRTALSMASVRRQVAGVQRLVWIVAMLVSVSVAALTYWVVTRIIRPVTALTKVAEAIGKGDYQQRITLPHRDELSQLAEAFNRMSQQLDAQVAELRTSGERLATVLGGMIEGVIAVDDRQRVLFANAAAEMLLEFSSAQAAGWPLLSTVRHHTLHQTVEETLTTGVAQQAKIELRGTGRTVEVNSAPLPGTPCPGVVLVLRDVTELLRLESVRQEFVANVSHELKTPLSSIKAYAETLSQGAIEDPENRLVFVQRIEEQVERLHRLIIDLLSLARIESGQLAFDIESICVADVVNASLSRHRSQADAKNICLACDPSQEALHVRADEEGLLQILDNLIDNAIKYTPGQGQVTVTWHVEDSMAVICVQDTGIGIAAEDQARLFERFFRVDKARSRELGGTGLGLSIVKHLALFFGGTVGVKSRAGQGSTFWVRLPLA
jgi:two-component system phosphate regulon sensor histidine kinase PhoR